MAQTCVHVDICTHLYIIRYIHLYIANNSQEFLTSGCNMRLQRVVYMCIIGCVKLWQQSHLHLPETARDGEVDTRATRARPGKTWATVKIIALRSYIYTYKCIIFGDILQNLAHSLENKAVKPITKPLCGMFSWSAWNVVNQSLTWVGSWRLF